MVKRLKILGIIPARGGSKSIPRKNIKPFLGKPLIGWSIEALQKSGVCDRIVVSTDDKEIAETAKKFGAEVPFIRPAELARDATPTLPVLQHAIKWLKDNENYEPDAVVLTQATSPGVRAFHFKEGLELFFSSGAHSVVSVVETPANYNPHWQFSLASADGRLELFTGAPVKNVIRRRQELPKTYVRNSAFYIFKPSLLFEAEPSFYGEDVRGYVMDNVYNIDIDSPDDWADAEKKLKAVLQDGK
jgi:N-acylneuraminate cytidylyltransferase